MTAQEFFKNDLFATNAGVELIEIREGYSKAKLEIKPEHLNAGQRTQGGAIFTLAEARERYTGRSTGYYQIDVTDQEGRLIATFESSVFRKKDEVPFTL